MTAAEIKQERLNRLWTQAELAQKAKVTTVQICEWETGKYKPSLRSQRKLKEVFTTNPVV
jgi:DNA-binding XRE family transcriptional regulator